MVRDRRSVDAANAAASGIYEEITETDQFLDDLIRRRDREEEMKKVKRDKESLKEAKINQKSLELCSEASSRTNMETTEEKKELHQERKRR